MARSKAAICMAAFLTPRLSLGPGRWIELTSNPSAPPRMLLAVADLFHV